MVIEISTGGTAFHSPVRDELFDRCILSSELDRLFRQIYSDIRHDSKTEGTLIDVNGSEVGYWNLNDNKDGESKTVNDLCDYAEHTGTKKREFEYLKSFSREAFFDTEVCRDQLRSLWTAYCLHNDLIVDTGAYDSDILELWSVVSISEEDTAEWSDFDSFDNFMCAYLV